MATDDNKPLLTTCVMESDTETEGADSDLDPYINTRPSEHVNGIYNVNSKQTGKGTNNICDKACYTLLKRWTDLKIKLSHRIATTKPSHAFLNMTLTTITMSLGMVTSFCIPLYTFSATRAGSDIYCALMFAVLCEAVVLQLVALFYKYALNPRVTLSPRQNIRSLLSVGLLNAVGGIMQIYASSPDRTPPYLQALVGNVGIPLTIFVRFLVLRKGMLF